MGCKPRNIQLLDVSAVDDDGVDPNGMVTDVDDEELRSDIYNDTDG